MRQLPVENATALGLGATTTISTTLARIVETALVYVDAKPIGTAVFNSSTRASQVLRLVFTVGKNQQTYTRVEAAFGFGATHDIAICLTPPSHRIPWREGSTG